MDKEWPWHRNGGAGYVGDFNCMALATNDAFSILVIGY